MQTLEEDRTVLLLVKTESIPQIKPKGTVAAAGRPTCGELWILLDLGKGKASLLAFKFTGQKDEVVKGEGPTVHGVQVVNARQRFTVPMNGVQSQQWWTNRNVLEGKSLPFLRHPAHPLIIISGFTTPAARGFSTPF